MPTLLRQFTMGKQNNNNDGQQNRFFWRRNKRRGSNGQTQSTPVTKCLAQVKNDFQATPFCITDGVKELGDMYRMKALDNLIESAEGWGNEWVESKADGLSSLSLASAQDDVIQKLKSSRAIELSATELGLVPLHARFEEASKARKFTVAFCGMVKAGKSTFLNALVGKDILPTSELPSTAWPCRVRHEKGRKEPLLRINPQPLLEGVKELNTRSKEDAFNFSDYDPFQSALDDKGDGAQPDDTNSRLADLHESTRNNLRKFESEGYTLRDSAEGIEAVTDLLAEVNDIIRLCRRFDVTVDIGGEWPLVFIEFESLLKSELDYTFEFIDLPGMGESYLNYDFEDLISRAAKEANAIVPIVSFKEIPRSDWRLIPNLIRTTLSRAPDMVICTHYDEIMPENLEVLQAKVANEFWPRHSSSNPLILRCATRLGLSAKALRQCGSHPKYRDVWNRSAPWFYCAAKILGSGDPKRNFEGLQPNKWKGAVESALKSSGLDEAITQVTNAIAIASEKRAVLQSNQRLRHLCQVYRGDLKRVLSFSRSQEEYDKSYKNFQQIRADFHNFMKTRLTAVDDRYRTDSNEVLERLIGVLQKEIPKAVGHAVNETVRKSFGRNVPTFKSQAEANHFIKMAQSSLKVDLTTVKSKFVPQVRRLANEVRQEYLTEVENVIEYSPVVIVPEIKIEIMNDLEEQRIDFETLGFQDVVNKALRRDKRRFTAGTAFGAIERGIAGAFGEDPNDLGFMARAPIVVLTSISVVLGAGIWPFLSQDKGFILQKDELEKILLEKVADPFTTSLVHESKSTLKGFLHSSFKSARRAVEDAFDNEEKRYKLESERKKRNEPLTDKTITRVIASMANLRAGEGALGSIKVSLENLR